VSEVNVDSYLADICLVESMVLDFAHHESSQRVELVFDYAAEVVGEYFERLAQGGPRIPEVPPLRDFRQLLFCGVSAMRVDDPKISERVGYWKALKKIIDQPGLTIVFAEYKRLEDCCQLKLELNGDRIYTFVFESLKVERKLGKPVQDEDDDSCKYFDTETGAEIPFFEPFG